MKKVSFFPLVLVSLLMNHAYAQSRKTNGETTPMRVGSLFLNLGIGVGAEYKNPTYNTPFGFKASAEYGMWQAGPGVITLGPELGGSFSSERVNGKSYQSSTFIVAGRAAWHYGWEVPGLDTYGGFSAGIGFNHYSFEGYDNSSPLPVIGVFAGASYFISPTFGFNAEFGYDITNFQLGVVFKLE